MKKQYKIIRISILPLLLVINISSFSQSKEEIDEKLRQVEKIGVQLVSDQLNAWNEKNIDKFLARYSDSVKVKAYPNTLNYVGKQTMKEKYKRSFESAPQLKCEIVKRIIFGNKIIDYERITGYKDNWVNEAVAIYTITNNVISEVCFLNKSIN
jgi:hypothetical protein